MSREDRVAQVLGAWQEQREAGVFQDPEEVIAAHPDLEEELRAHFLAAEAVEQAYAETRFLRGDAPRRVGDYEIVREIGRGGMGIVYEAFQTSMQRRVALKVLFPAVTHSKRAVGRFQREARTAGRLQHTNIVPVYALGHDGGIWFYAMELIEGSSLAQVLTAMRGIGEVPGTGHETLLGGQVLAVEHADATTDVAPTQDPDDTASTLNATPAYYQKVASMFAEVADALSSAHAEGVIHRDVKPSNLMLDRKGQLKLLDFGLARMVDGSGGLTVTGEVLGTPVYMSPEQARARTDEIDHRTDVYSLGATLYEMLTLRPPFSGGEFAEVYRQILTTDPDSPRTRNQQIPKDLETIVLKAMEKEPASRYADAPDLAQDLRAFAEGRSIGARRVSFVERAWRRVKRNKVRTALLTALGLAAVLAGMLAVGRAREEARGHQLRYDLLLREATEALPGDWAQSGTGVSRDRALGAYAQAIGLLPQRQEAWVGRALAPGRTLGEALADADEAVARGLGARTGHRLRAHVLRQRNRFEDARREAALAGPLTADATSLETLLVGLYAQASAESEKALACFASLLTEVPPSSLLAQIARRHRTLLLMRVERYEEALRDLLALRAHGEIGPRTTAELAVVWKRLGKSDEAEAVLREFLQDAAHGELETMALTSTLLRHEKALARRAAEAGSVAWPQNGYFLGVLGHLASAADDLDAATEHLDLAVKLAPQEDRVHGWRALLLGELGRHDEALEEVAQALERAPDDPWNHQFHAAVLTSAGRLDAAYEAVERALALDPWFLASMRMRGLIRGRQGRADEAIELLEAVRQVYPADPLTHDALACAYHHQGQHEKAMERHDRAVALGPDEGQFHYNRAVCLYETGHAAESVPSYQRAIECRPSHAETRYNLGHAFGDLERWAEALAAFQSVLEWKPDHPEVWLMIGNCRRMLDDPEAALKAYRKQEELFPETRWLARNNQASTLLDLQRPAAALALLDETVKEHPKESHARFNARRSLASVHFNRSLALEALGRLDEAEQAMGQYAELIPNDAEPHWRRAFLFVRMRKKDEAWQAYEIADRLATDEAWQHFNRALLLKRLGERGRAITAARRCLELAPGFPGASGMLGELSLKTGKFEQALAPLEHARRLAPGDYANYANAASALLQLDRPAEAADLFTEAVERFPETVHPHVFLAWILVSAAADSIRSPAYALTLARKAVALEPTGWRNHMVLGMALYRTNRFPEALKSLETAATDHRAEPATSFFVAMALHRLGRREEAKIRFEAARKRRIEAGPDHPIARDLLRFEEEAAKLITVDALDGGPGNGERGEPEAD